MLPPARLRIQLYAMRRGRLRRLRSILSAFTPAAYTFTPQHPAVTPPPITPFPRSCAVVPARESATPISPQRRRDLLWTMPRAVESPATPLLSSGNDEVSVWLASLSISQYAKSLQDEGYDKLLFLCELDTVGIQELVKAVNMKKPHAKAFEKGLGELKQQKVAAVKQQKAPIRATALDASVEVMAAAAPQVVHVAPAVQGMVDRDAQERAERLERAERADRADRMERAERQLAAERQMQTAALSQQTILAQSQQGGRAGSAKNRCFACNGVGKISEKTSLPYKTSIRCKGAGYHESQTDVPPPEGWSALEPDGGRKYVRSTGTCYACNGKGDLPVGARKCAACNGSGIAFAYREIEDNQICCYLSWLCCPVALGLMVANVILETCCCQKDTPNYFDCLELKRFKQGRKGNVRCSKCKNGVVYRV